MVLELVEIIANSSDQQQDVTRKVASFRSSIQSCRDLVNKQPGLEMSLSQQERELALLKAQLKCKQELLDKFGNLEALTQNLVTKEES